MSLLGFFVIFYLFSSAVLCIRQVLREILVTSEIVMLHKLSMLIISHILGTNMSWIRAELY